MNPEILELWKAHCSYKFPRRFQLKSNDDEFFKLVLLDGDIAGCVSTFIENGGRLDLWRTAILGICYKELAGIIINNNIDKAAKDYFVRLETLSMLVLKDVIAREKQTAQQ